jgi:lysozyme
MFQYTSMGAIDGVSGNVDVNNMDKTFYDALTQEPAPPSPDRVTVIVNGTAIEGGRLIDGSVYVPLRAVGDALGAKVTWSNATQTATLTT